MRGITYFIKKTIVSPLILPARIGDRSLSFSIFVRAARVEEKGD